MAWHHKGKVAKCDHREYGFAQVEVVKAGEGSGSSVDMLFEGLGDDMQVRVL
jgi:GMP synthase (glutamine-hydrolysing)